MLITMCLTAQIDSSHSGKAGCQEMMPVGHIPLEGHLKS